MINFEFDKKDNWEEYKSAVERMRVSPDKALLQSKESTIKELYELYNQKILSNKLENLSSGINNKELAKAAFDLYSPQKTIIKNFRKRFYDNAPQTYYNLCPYCVINSANTTEHILPKDLFPEYAINLKNLIPACSECNLIKGTDLLNSNSEKLTINYYIDNLPDDYYLFVDFKIKGLELTYNYYLSDTNLSSQYRQVYNLISRHFEKYKLLDRYWHKFTQLLSELVNTYLAENFQTDSEYDNFAQKQINICRMCEKSYGKNHYKIVAQRCAAQSSVFKDYIMEKTKGLIIP